jgi:heme exporter protein D
VFPSAHVGHYALWVLYAIPILIVAFAIVRSTLTQRRAGRDVADSDREA